MDKHDSVRKLNQMRPRHPKGRRQVKSRRPNRITAKRIWQDRAVAHFVLDAIEEGILVGDGKGHISKVRLESPNPETLCRLLDQDVIGHHRELKSRSKTLQSKVVLLDGDNKEVDPESVYRPDDSPAAPRKQSREEMMLAKVAAREREIKAKERRVKAKRKKAFNHKKLKEKAIVALLEYGIPVTPEAISVEIRKIKNELEASYGRY